MNKPVNPLSTMNRTTAYWMIGLAIGIGGISLPAFGVFLLLGPLFSIRLSLGTEAAFGLNTALSLLFFLQHSLMVRTAFKKRQLRIISETYQGAIYAIASGVCLWLVLLFWQPSQTILLAVDGWIGWGMRMIFGLAFILFLQANKALGKFDSLGAFAILYRLHNKPAPRQEFRIRGPYRWVRHPIYFITLLMIWSYPNVTLDRMQFNILWTLWIIVGAWLEERDMAATHGTAYRNYQKKVPMLIPLPGKRADSSDLNPPQN